MPPALTILISFYSPCYKDKNLPPLFFSDPRCLYLEDFCLEDICNRQLEAPGLTCDRQRILFNDLRLELTEGSLALVFQPEQKTPKALLEKKHQAEKNMGTLKLDPT